jgi:hypothetical protein
MRIRTGTCLFVSVLAVGYLTACSASGPSAAPSSLPSHAKRMDGPSRPAVVAFNHSSIVEVVTQPAPNCWSPTGATIKPGDYAVFEPISISPCTTPRLIANATGVSCILGWNGEMITISNSPDALCGWTLNSTLREGVWIYQFRPTTSGP